MTLFIGLAGVPYLLSPFLYVLQFLILFLIFILRKKLFDKLFVFFIISLFTITLLQALKFNFFPLETNIGIFTRVISAYLIVKILGNKFIKYYINILYYIAITSFLIYFPILLFPSMGTFLLQNIVPIFDILNFANSPDETIIIYNLRSFSRNSGPFWEAGAFAGYLIIAFIFNFIIEKKKIDRKKIVLLIAIITTLSTTAYLALFVFFFFIYYKKVKSPIVKFGAIAIIASIGFYAYTTFDFLGKKIEAQVEYAQKKGIEKSDDSQRFLSILRDMKDLEGHELIGRGANDHMRYDLNPGEEVLIRTVGLTDILVRVGLPFFLLMMYFLYRSICSYLMFQNQRNIFSCIGLFVTILITLMSETYFIYPMYWSLLFLQFVYKKPNEEKSISIGNPSSIVKKNINWKIERVYEN